MLAKAYLDLPRNRIRVEFDECDEGEAYAFARMVTNSRRARNGGGYCMASHYPLSVDKCNEMRQAWGVQVMVHKELSAWYREASVDRAAQAARSTQGDATLTVVPVTHPQLNEWLFGDQRVTAAWMANAYRGGGLLADEVGTGKTAGVIAGLIEAKRTGRILVICPKVSVKAVWGKHFMELWPDVPVYLGRGTRAQREKVLAAYEADQAPTKVLVVVAEMLRIKAIRHGGRIKEFLGFEYPTMFDKDWDTVVVDESHKLLGSLDVVRGTLAGEGLRRLPLAKDRLKIIASATPFGKGGRIDALFGSLHWLWPDEFSSRWAWLPKYFEVNEDRVFIKGGKGETKLVKRVGGLLPGVTEKDFWNSLGPRVLRRTMEEVSPAHRGLKRWYTVPCEMDKDQAKAYATFVTHGELAVDGGIISSFGVLDFMTRCRQLANGVLRREGGGVRYTGDSCKLERLMDHLENTGHFDGTATRKVIVTSQYNEFLDAVERQLDKEGCSYLRLDGKTSDSKRDEMMSRFQEDPVFRGPQVTCPRCQVGRDRPHGARCYDGSPLVFLLNSQAGGVSITLDAADEMHQLDRMYPPEANTQLYGRIFRRGRVHEVFFYLYVSMGTIDENVNEKVEAGLAEQLRALDGRRGIEYVRELATYRP